MGGVDSFSITVNNPLGEFVLLASFIPDYAGLEVMAPSCQVIQQGPY